MRQAKHRRDTLGTSCLVRGQQRVQGDTGRCELCPCSFFFSCPGASNDKARSLFPRPFHSHPPAHEQGFLKKEAFFL